MRPWGCFGRWKISQPTDLSSGWARCNQGNYKPQTGFYLQNWYQYKNVWILNVGSQNPNLQRIVVVKIVILIWFNILNSYLGWHLIYHYRLALWDTASQAGEKLFIIWFSYFEIHEWFCFKTAVVTSNQSGILENWLKFPLSLQTGSIVTVHINWLHHLMQLTGVWNQFRYQSSILLVSLLFLSVGNNFTNFPSRSGRVGRLREEQSVLQTSRLRHSLCSAAENT